MLCIDVRHKLHNTIEFLFLVWEIISQLSDFKWPSRGRVLTFYGATSMTVFTRIIVFNLQDLTTNICQLIAEVLPKMSEKMMENFLKAIDYYNQSREGYVVISSHQKWLTHETMTHRGG